MTYLSVLIIVRKFRVSYTTIEYIMTVLHIFGLFQIWEAVDDKQGYLTRNGLYKALALTALAQQGKSINDKILESYMDQGTT